MKEIIHLILTRHGVNQPAYVLNNMLKYEPYNNSLYALSNILNKFNIANRGIKLEDKYLICEDLCPFVTILNNHWVLIDSISNDVVKFFEDDHKKHLQEMPLENFITQWNGRALIIDSIPQNELNMSLTDSIKISRYERFFTYAALAVSIYLFIYGVLTNLKSYEWTYYALILTNSAGIFISILLLQKQLHIPNKLTDRICGLVAENDCGTVTDSNGGRLFGIIKLSEIGLSFFGVNLICVILGNDIYFWFGIVATAVLPFSFWSLYYQKAKAKSWCALCLIVLILMWFQAIFVWIGGYLRFPNEVWPMGLALCCTYLLTVWLTNWVMKLIQAKIEGEEWHIRYNDIKLDEIVIDTYMSEGITSDISTQNCSCLIFGNPEAEKTITVFSNPYCGPCASRHNQIKDLPGDCVKVQYVMTYFTEEKSKVNKYIIAAYIQLGSELTWNILTQWFAGGKNQGIAFFDRYNLNITMPEVTTEFEKQVHWPDNLPLQGTPTDFINGREIIWPYNVEDYPYLS